jgi:hypothetical protein
MVMCFQVCYLKAEEDSQPSTQPGLTQAGLTQQSLNGY